MMINNSSRKGGTSTVLNIIKPYDIESNDDYMQSKGKNKRNRFQRDNTIKSWVPH